MRAMLMAVVDELDEEHSSSRSVDIVFIASGLAEPFGVPVVREKLF